MIAIAVLILRAALGLALVVPQILMSGKILAGLAVAATAVLFVAPVEEARAHDVHSGNYPLHTAAQRGQVSVVVHLLGDEHNIDVNATTSFGYTPLHWAANAGSNSCSPVVVMTLIAAGANVNAKAMYDGTPLVRALEYGVKCPDVVDALLDAGADVCQGDGCEGWSNYSPLGLLAIYGVGGNDITVARSLIRRGHDVNDGGGLSDTPLYRAWHRVAGSLASWGHGWYGMVDLLIESGGHYGTACPGEGITNPRRGYRDNPGPECLCPEPNVIADGVCQIPSQASCAARDAGERHYNGTECEPLHPCHETANRKTDNSGCECPPDKPFTHGNPAVDRCYAHSEHAPITHTLFTRSAFARAIKYNNPELVGHLLDEHGEDPNRYVSGGYPVNIATENDYPGVLATLIAAGATYTDNGGYYSLLHRAARHNSFRIAAMLLASGAEIGSAFHAAAELGHMEVVAVFINAGANLNKRVSGKTPLDLARENGYRAVMIRLAAAGGNWGDPCTGGKVANPHARPQDGVPECVCRVGTLDRNNDGVCESDSDENIAAQLAALRKELTDLRAELAMLRASLPTSDENAMVRLRELSARAYAAEQGIRTLGGDPGKAGVWRLEVEVPAGQRFWAEPVSGCRVREWEGCAGTGVPGGLGERKSCRPSGTGRATVGVVFACD